MLWDGARFAEVSPARGLAHRTSARSQNLSLSLHVRPHPRVPRSLIAVILWVFGFLDCGGPDRVCTWTGQSLFTGQRMRGPFLLCVASDLDVASIGRPRRVDSTYIMGIQLHPARRLGPTSPVRPQPHNDLHTSQKQDVRTNRRWPRRTLRRHRPRPSNLGVLVTQTVSSSLDMCFRTRWYVPTESGAVHWSVVCSSLLPIRLPAPASVDVWILDLSINGRRSLARCSLLLLGTCCSSPESRLDRTLHTHNIHPLL